MLAKRLLTSLTGRTPQQEFGEAKEKLAKESRSLERLLRKAPRLTEARAW